MKQTRRLSFGVVLAVGFAFLGGVGDAFTDATGTVVFDSIPTVETGGLFVTPPNVPSLGFQATQTDEFGDRITLEELTPRRVGYVTVLMSNWAKHSDYASMPAAGYMHPITLNIYADAGTAAAHAPMATKTTEFLVPWRPEADPTCAGGTAWRAANGNCYNGFAFKIVFDLRALGLVLPETFIYGVAYNTNTWGYAPIGQSGPFESLNVGLRETALLNVTPILGSTDMDEVFWNTHTNSNYTDGGLPPPTHVFRPDTDWGAFVPAIQFSAFDVPESIAACKNGAWKNLVRTDFTVFKSQGDCVSYVNTGK